MAEHYTLDANHEVHECDLLTWARALDNTRRVAAYEKGDVLVSTVFLGLNHRFGDGPPLLFETLVFGGPLDGEMDRYSTWDEAVAGHNAIVARVQQDHSDEARP